MVRPMRKTRAPTQSQRAIGHIAALQSIATMFVMHAMVGRSTLQFKMPRLDAYGKVTGRYDATIDDLTAIENALTTVWKGWKSEPRRSIALLAEDRRRKERSA